MAVSILSLPPSADRPNQHAMQHGVYAIMRTEQLVGGGETLAAARLDACALDHHYMSGHLGAADSDSAKRRYAAGIWLMECYVAAHNRRHSMGAVGGGRTDMTDDQAAAWSCYQRALKSTRAVLPMAQQGGALDALVRVCCHDQRTVKIKALAMALDVLASVRQM